MKRIWGLVSVLCLSMPLSICALGCIAGEPVSIEQAELEAESADQCGDSCGVGAEPMSRSAVEEIISSEDLASMGSDSSPGNVVGGRKKVTTQWAPCTDCGSGWYCKDAHTVQYIEDRPSGCKVLYEFNCANYCWYRPCGIPDTCV